MTKREKRYIQGFLVAVVLLGVVRCVFPSVAGEAEHKRAKSSELRVRSSELKEKGEEGQEIATQKGAEPLPIPPSPAASRSRFFRPDGSPVRNRIHSVPSFKDAFPDQNDVQLLSAQRWGVQPVDDRENAESRKAELVYAALSPYYHVDRLRQSIPYLVPRAAILLQDIGRTFYDSLQMKGVPLHQFIVSSMLRTRADVQRLRNFNHNATVNSCHTYGTTFDIAYNRYETVCAPGENRRKVRNDTLKWVLSEVLRDMRAAGRCHVKYEVKQGCFHITVR